MQADRTLTEGHYRAIASEALLGQATHEGIMNIINSIGDDLDFKKKQAGNYDEEMQKVLDNYGLPSNAEQQNIHNTLAGPLMDEYINAEKSRQQAILKQQANMSEQEKKYHDIMHETALNYFNGGLNNNWKTTDIGKTIMGMPMNANLVLDPIKGEDWGVNMPDFEVINATKEQLAWCGNEINALESMYDQDGVDGDGQALDDLYKQIKKLQEILDAKPIKWNSMQQFESIVKQGEYDRGVAKVYQDMLTSYKIKGSNQKGDILPANVNEINDAIWSGVINKGKYDSMWYNEMVPGRIAYDDLTNVIMGKNVGGRTYKDFGITDVQLSDAAGADDKIDIDEAKNLATAVVESKETDGNGHTLGQRALHGYLSQGAINQYNIGTSDNTDVDDEDNTNVNKSSEQRNLKKDENKIENFKIKNLHERSLKDRDDDDDDDDDEFEFMGGGK